MTNQNPNLRMEKLESIWFDEKFRSLEMIFERFDLLDLNFKISRDTVNKILILSQNQKKSS